MFTPVSIVPVGAVAHSRLPADIQDECQVEVEMPQSAAP